MGLWYLAEQIWFAEIQSTNVSQAHGRARILAQQNRDAQDPESQAWKCCISTHQLSRHPLLTTGLSGGFVRTWLRVVGPESEAIPVPLQDWGGSVEVEWGRGKVVVWLLGQR